MKDGSDLGPLGRMKVKGGEEVQSKEKEKSGLGKRHSVRSSIWQWKQGAL